MPFELDYRSPDTLTAWLREAGVIGQDDAVVGLESAGPGNMNLTLRARLSRGSVIVKQARAWVERHPHIAAPPERAAVEAAFYRAVSEVRALTDRMPRLLHADAADAMLVLEDLGPSSDLTDLYRGAVLTDADLDALLAWMRTLHHTLPPSEPLLANRAMRRLNHEHVFDLPFRPRNGIDLEAWCPGLGPVAKRITTDVVLTRRVLELGQLYLADGRTLIHGDYYPGSWLRAPRGLCVIDPEFAHLGDPAFDHGVLCAHLVLSRQSEHLVDRALADAPPGTCAFAAVEVLRRLLGVAQLPLDGGLAERTEMIERAAAWLR